LIADKNYTHVKTETHFMPYYNKRNNKLLRIGIAKQKTAELQNIQRQRTHI